MSHVERVPLSHEGAELIGSLLLPAGPGPHPVVMVMSSAMGPGPHYLEIGRKLAAQGYAALVTDMYGGGAAFSVPVEAGPFYSGVCEEPGLVRRRSVVWFEALQARQDIDANCIAAIGYCFGGFCVLELARSGADVKAAVSFHGQLTTTNPAEPGTLKGLLAIYTGGKDPFAPLEDVPKFQAEMRQAGHERYHVTVFADACHSFTTKQDGALPVEGLAYDPLADAVSWAGTLALLRQILMV
jgi:dienelactone hydrolase